MATSQKGLPFIGKMNEYLDRVLHPTVNKTGNSSAALDVVGRSFYAVNGIDTPYVVEASSTDNILNKTGLNARPGDVIRILTSANGIKEFEIVVHEAPTVDQAILAGYLSASLATGDTFHLLRSVRELAAANGASLATVISPPIQIIKNGTVQTVEDSTTPADVVAVPVKIMAADGTNINIVAGDINIQTSAEGTNFDSMRIGDGTSKYAAITANNEIKTKDTDLASSIGSQADAAASTDTGTFSQIALLKRLLSKTPSLGQQARVASQSVILASDSNVVSTVNSTTANLAISGVFTGTSENVSQYAEIKVLVFANQNSVSNGLSIQQSSDGTNWDIVDTYTVTANTPLTIGVGVDGVFFRLVYTNGTTATTILRIQAVYHMFRTRPSSVRPQDTRSNEIDVEESSSYQMSYNGTSWDRIRSGLNGAVSSILGYQNVLPVAKFTTADPTLTNNQWHDLRMDVNGNLKTAITGAITANLGTIAGAATEITLAGMSAKLPLSLGVKAASASISTTNSTEDAAAIGAISETAPTTDIAAAGLNGRLQRIAQRLSSLITLLPSSVGAKTSAGSLSVVLASDQIAINTSQVAQTSTYDQSLVITDSAPIVLTAPAGAKWCKVMASDSNSAYLKVAIGATASATNGMEFQPGRSEDYMACGNISVIAMTTASNQKLFVQWGA